MKIVDSIRFRDWERIVVIKVDMYVWEDNLSPYYKGWADGWVGIDYLKFITEVRREFN